MDANTKVFYNEGLNAKVSEFNPYNRYTQILAHHAFECGFVDMHRRSSSIPA